LNRKPEPVGVYFSKGRPGLIYPDRAAALGQDFALFRNHRGPAGGRTNVYH
jgi:hypothetical protein